MDHEHAFNTYDRCRQCGVRKVVLVREYLQGDHDLDTRQEVVTKALAIVGEED